MTKEMPRHYWKNLPDAGLIPQLLAESAPRTDAMVAISNARRKNDSAFAAAAVPDAHDLSLHRAAAATCRACPLWQNATCTVFGEGPSRPRIIVVARTTRRSGRPDRKTLRRTGRAAFQPRARRRRDRPVAALCRHLPQAAGLPGIADRGAAAGAGRIILRGVRENRELLLQVHPGKPQRVKRKGEAIAAAHGWRSGLLRRTFERNLVLA